MRDRCRRRSPIARAAGSRAQPSQQSPTPNSANGARIAVSFARAATANHNAASTNASSTYADSPQKMNPAAARSTCTRELCAKNTGYNAVHSVEAIATCVFATRSASRNTPSSENAAKNNIAVRATKGAKPMTFHHNATHAITSGGCAFETVE